MHEYYFMVLFPNAKINLGLNIIEKRPDGYHNLETVFYPVTWRDVLEIIPSDTTSLTVSGILVDGNFEENLVIKALRLLQHDFDIGNFSVFLQKNIPFGAGLGGGSADGACMLTLLNRQCNLSLSNEQLAAYAIRLGADCPFFIYNRPMFADGIGDRLEPIDINLESYRMVILKPATAVSTAEAYSMVKPHKPDVPLKSLITLPVANWRSVVVNDFEASVFARHPELEHLKALLYEQGAFYASMSGSGSALYGIFPSNIYPRIDVPDCKVWISN